jgi:glutaredoxin
MAEKQLVLYTKPGCCLCETLEEKLRQIQPSLGFTLEVRNIVTNLEWFSDFQYTIPVLEIAGKTLSGISHRDSLQNLQNLLAKAFS